MADEEKVAEKASLMNKVKEVYEHKYKLLMLIPFILIFLAITQISIQYATTGDFVHKGVSLKGGSTIAFSQTDNIDVEELQSYLSEKFSGMDLNVRTISSAGRVVSIAVDSDVQDEAGINALVAALEEKTGLKESGFSVEVMGSSLGKSFFKQTLTALLAAFILIGIVVILYFRNWIPSLAIMLCGFSDLTVTLAIFNLTGEKLSTAGIGAFLMLIGYSIDTDMLLTTRVLKLRSEKSVMDMVYSSVRTGLMMTATALAAIMISLIFVQSEVVKQIMLILFIGLVVDMIMTWVQNVGVLRLYLEKKNIK